MRSISKMPIPGLLTIKINIKFMLLALLICNSALSSDYSSIKENGRAHFKELSDHLDESAIVGSFDDLVSAAAEGRQPLYFKQLMDNFCKKLFAQGNRIETPQEAQVWAFIMCKIFEYIYSSISNAVLKNNLSEYPRNIVVYRVSTPAWRAVKAMIDFAAFENSIHMNGELDFSEFEKGLRTAEAAIIIAQNAYLGYLNSVDGYKAKYLIAEWALLNYFYQNMEAFFRIFPAKRVFVPPSQPNKFNDKDALMPSYISRFGELGAEELIFIVPWLIQIPFTRELWLSEPMNPHRQAFMHFSGLDDRR